MCSHSDAADEQTLLQVGGVDPTDTAPCCTLGSGTWTSSFFYLPKFPFCWLHGTWWIMFKYLSFNCSHMEWNWNYLSNQFSQYCFKQNLGVIQLAYCYFSNLPLVFSTSLPLTLSQTTEIYLPLCERGNFMKKEWDLKQHRPQFSIKRHGVA